MKAQPEKGNAPGCRSPEASSVKNQPFKEGINMSNSTVAPAPRAITVPFHGADLRVIEHNGQPYTPMKPIVQGMGLTWQSQHRKVASNQARWGMVEITMPSTVADSTTVGLGLNHQLDDSGQRRAMSCISLRKLPGWLSTIEQGKVKNPEVRARVIQYQNECDDALWQYWNDGIAVNPRVAYAVNPGDTLTKEQADTLRQMIEGTAKKLFVDTNQQGAFIRMAWSKLKSHFKVSYRQIPQHELTEAISIINRHTAEWDMTGAEPSASLSLVDCGDKTKVGSFLLAARKRAAQHLARIDKELAIWELVDDRKVGVLPESQMREITTRLDRLSSLFHPSSSQFVDAIGIGRALRGLHPKLSMQEPGWVQVIPRIGQSFAEVAA